MDVGQDSVPRRDASAQQLAADIRTTRRELAATVEALAHKMDVGARLRETADRWRIRLRELLETPRGRARQVRGRRTKTLPGGRRQIAARSGATGEVRALPGGRRQIGG